MSAAYSVTFKATAEKSLNKLPKSVQDRIIEKAISLGNNPRVAGSTKLAGKSGLWRVRIGVYRMLYLIDDHHHTVDIRIIAHRREVYRDL